jgi:mevalonate kinase
VHGHPAVGISLPETTTVSLVDLAPGADWDCGAVVEGDRAICAALIEALRKLMPEIQGCGACRVTVESDVPRAAGFGSSAALCAALARAARAHVLAGRLGGTGDQGPADSDAEWALAHDLEKLFHGTPSGVDTGLALRDGTWAFRPRPPGLPTCERLPGALPPLVVAAVQRDESCGALVADLSRRRNAGDERVIRSIDTLGNLAGAARDALRPGASDPAVVLADLAERAMVVLRDLGLSVPAIDEMLDTGKQAGALGGKLSGAGGGGAFYLVARSARDARGIARRLTEEASRAGLRMASPPRVLTDRGRGSR